MGRQQVGAVRDLIKVAARAVDVIGDDKLERSQRVAANSGYHHCPCRDCFEIAIGCDDAGVPDFCSVCADAGCYRGPHECCAPGAYGE